MKRFCSLLLICALSSGLTHAATSLVQYGFFDCTYYNSGDSFVFGEQKRGVIDWDMPIHTQAVNNALDQWTSVINNTPGRNLSVGLIWCEEGMSTNTLATGGGPFYGTGPSIWSASAELVWRDGYSESLSQHDIYIMVSSLKYDIFSFSDVVESTKWDFQSVIAHEIGHALGLLSIQSLGHSNTWDSLMRDSEGRSPLDAGFTFQNGVSTIGSDRLVLANQSHLDGTSLPDALMQPSILPGIRRDLTDAEIGLLSQMGWDVNLTASIPEPSAITLGLVGMMALFTRRTRRVA